MSTLVSSLKKQNELLAAEVELYANAVDRLAVQLAEAQNEIQALKPSAEGDTQQMVPASESEEDGEKAV